MSEAYAVGDIREAMFSRLFPTVTVWNRLEGRPRSVEFQRALRAEVRDALWMLTRQWQVGEFRGDDAGSPVTARMHVSSTQLTRFRPEDDTPVPIDRTVPLEAVVERRAVGFVSAGGPVRLDLRLALGRYWLRLVDPGLRDAFVAAYPFTVPDPEDPADTDRCAHPTVWATLQAVAGRAMDGYLLLAHLQDDPGHRAYDGMAVADADKPALDTAAAAFQATWARLLQQPDAVDAWNPQRLEHRFAVAGPSGTGEKVLVAEEYPGGSLDWPAFSVAGRGRLGADEDALDATGKPVQRSVVRTVVPAPVAYDGMPDARWWSFEDGRTNFGDVRADTTDLARLLFLDFALVYGNDWYVIPCELPVGTVARVEGLAVTNVFGERLWVDAAGSGADEDWQRWSMFSLDVAGNDDVAADTSLLLLPTVPTVQEGPVLEDVRFVRDEMANMVWGIERTVLPATGEPQRGAEVAAEGLAHRTRLAEAAAAAAAAATPSVPAPVPAAAAEAKVAYQVMNTVPEHWIPFVPVHVPGDVRQVQLQRAALPRLLEGGPADDRVRPRTSLLREGLDVDGPTRRYFVFEEEVPRSGTDVELRYQRTRWLDGRVVLWSAAHRTTAGGEARSDLGFDRLVPTDRAR